jgi:hypothetical protein
VLRDLLDGAQRLPYHLRARLPVLVVPLRRSPASLALLAVSLAAEDPRHQVSLAPQAVSLLPVSLAVRLASLLDSLPEVLLPDLTRLDGDEDDDFWSMLTIPPTTNLQTAGLMRSSVESRHEAVWAATIDALPFLSECGIRRRSGVLQNWLGLRRQHVSGRTEMGGAIGAQ